MSGTEKELIMFEERGTDHKTYQSLLILLKEKLEH